MFRKLSALLLIVGMLCVIGCAAHTHKIGNGAQGTDMIEARQWYVLWGFVPINDIDTQAMADGATDYEITTEVTLIDGLIVFVTSTVSFHCRTVTVRR